MEKIALKNVLVVDDDSDYNFLTNVSFAETGLDCKLVFKERAKEALTYLEENSQNFPDLILLDINMPVMNGWEFLEEYQKRKYHSLQKTLIIMLSSSVYHEDKEKAKTFHRVIEYIEKPLSCDLIQHIKNNYFA